MQKYRRWTDEKAGVNPFVAADTSKASFIEKFFGLGILLVKGSIFIIYYPLFILMYCIPIAFLQKFAAGIMLLLLGVYNSEDYSLDKLDKNGKRNIILSNHSCFLDAIYFAYRYPGCKFLGFSENQQGKQIYFFISPISVFFALLTSVQFFYRLNERKGEEDLATLIKSDKNLEKGSKLIIFYQKIRTNGKGTIRINKSILQPLFELQRDLIVAQIKYVTKEDKIFKLTVSAISLLISTLSTLTSGNNMKIRATKQDLKDIHSVNELKETINSMSSGALLDTSPRSFYEFQDFYSKTQKQGYKLEE